MNATNANQTSLQAEQKAHEPSMEDILASIRKIIADDDALPLSRRATPARAEPARPEPARPEPAKCDPAKSEPAKSEPAKSELARPELARAELARPEPGAGVAWAEPPLVEPPRVPAPAPLAFADTPLKPPPIPHLRDLALRLDSIPLRSAPQVMVEPAPTPPALRRSLDDALPPDARLPEAVWSEPPEEDVTPQASAKPTAPVVHAVAVGPASDPEPNSGPKPSVPKPSVPKPSVGFAAGGFKVPPLSFQSNVPPPPVSLVSVGAPRDPAPPPAEPQMPAAVQPAGPMESPVTASLSARMGLPAPRFDRVEPAMLSQNSGLKVSAAFEALAESALLRDPEMVERLTREILRPMIKTWLDDNLPNVVERLVRAEIERVARGPRG